MAFTYNGDLSDPLQYVRFQINDTDDATPIYQDGEINYFISKIEGEPTEKDLDLVAIRLLKKFLYKLSMGPSRERAGAYEVYGISAETVKTLISDLEKEVGSLSTPQVMFGGVYKSGVEKNHDNPSLTHPTWHKDQFHEDDADDNRFY